ncbi:dihydrolipoyl dehydrogenase [Acidobacteriota bacterium]
MEIKCDIAVFGGGPGGYVAALRGAQLKKKVVLIEREQIGGTCMNRGCIPTKFLLHQTQMFRELKDNPYIDGPVEKLKLNWVGVQEGKRESVDRLVKGIEFLLKKNGVQVVRGEARLKSEKEVTVFSKEDTKILPDNIILATGSESACLPFIQPDGKEIITSTDALELHDLPRRLLIIGAGAIGLELGTIFHRMGCEVTILEVQKTVLPGIDRDMAVRLERLLKAQGLKVHTQMKIEKCTKQDGSVGLEGINLKTLTRFDFEADKVLLAAGRTPNSEGFKGIDARLKFDAHGFLKVKDTLETGIPGIYAVGDLIGGKLLAHKASHEGIIAVENACGEKRSMIYSALPSAVFTEPEFASVGITKNEAEKKGISLSSGLFSLQANSRALTMSKLEGVVKIFSDSEERILGAQIISPHASEIIMEVTIAIHNGLKLSDLSSVVHIHPTVSEAVMEAALKIKGEAIHMLNT